jgi:hypothetical protein
VASPRCDCPCRRPAVPLLCRLGCRGLTCHIVSPSLSERVAPALGDPGVPCLSGESAQERTVGERELWPASLRPMEKPAPRESLVQGSPEPPRQPVSACGPWSQTLFVIGNESTPYQKRTIVPVSVLNCSRALPLWSCTTATSSVTRNRSLTFIPFPHSLSLLSWNHTSRHSASGATASDRPKRSGTGHLCRQTFRDAARGISRDA